MTPVTHVRTISEIGRFIQQPVRHPLVAVVDFSTVQEYIPEGTRISCDFYSVMFKNYCINNMRYGRNAYDFQEGSLVCVAPGQVLTMDSAVEQREDPMGWGLFFHPDLMRGTSLSARMKDYSFFSYETSEALHLSEKEKQTLYDCIQKINVELGENIDGHSQTLIVSNIELLMNYCSRYYGRQFITRKNVNQDVLARVERLLNDCFSSERLPEKGLPSVKYLAEQIHLSPNYLSDLLKRETGMNAQEHIHRHLIKEAKRILLNTSQSVGEVAYELGFEYPQYFSKLFKQKTGMTPQEFRNLN